MSTQIDTPVCLTIAGSDCCGGAGIQADLRTFSRFNVYGTSVVTAVTSQTPSRVYDVYGLPQDVIASQLTATMASASIACIKIGMVHSSATLTTLSHHLADTDCPVVMDPVLAAGSGDQLNERLPRPAVLEFIKNHVSVLTPNIPEAEFLLDCPSIPLASLKDAACALKKMCDADIYLKGGHAPDLEDQCVDFVTAGEEVYTLTAPPLQPQASHGTGCTLSAALAAGLANGCTLVNAAVSAKAFVWQSLNNGITLKDEFSAMFPPETLDTSMVACDQR